jgi:hypothetical protein
MAVVVDLDPLRRPRQLERSASARRFLPGARGLGEAAIDLLLGVALGLADHPHLIAALRDLERHLALGRSAKASQSRSASGTAAVGQDQLGRRHSS